MQVRATDVVSSVLEMGIFFGAIVVTVVGIVSVR
jgi:fucose permease